jgi:hypothetical protein
MEVTHDLKLGVGGKKLGGLMAALVAPLGGAFMGMALLFLGGLAFAGLVLAADVLRCMS